MTEREKIINIVEQNKYCDINTSANCRECKYGKELENYKDMGCSSLKTADALIAAGFGDVTEWKENVECAKRILQIPTLPDGKTDLSYFEYKGERIQDIVRQRDEYKHRAEVALRALLDCIKDSKPAHCSIAVCSKWTRCGDDACVETRKAMFIEQAEKELAEEA